MVTRCSYIVKFVLSLHLMLSKPQMNHVITFMQGMVLCDGWKNISQIRRVTHQPRDLSCMTRFLNESPWLPNRITRRRQQFIMEKIKRARAKRGDTRPVVFLIIDDTQCKKDVSTKHMEGLDFYFSHADGKSVWSHSLVTAHIVSDSYSFAWDFRSYFRESYCEAHGTTFKSKNDLAVELINDYARFHQLGNEQVYVLVDSWYTSKKLIDACNQKGFHLIGAFRINRKLYPKGIGIKTSAFASQFIRKSDLHSVTVDGHSYKVYPYEGPLSDVENVKVLLSWEKAFDPSQPPFCLLCTDLSLNLVTILRYYEVRWHIETGYRYFKELLGFDQYQHLSHKGIELFWNLQFLVYTFLEHQRHEWGTSNFLTLGDVVRHLRQEHLGQLVVYGYEQALAKRPIKEVLKSLKLAA